MKGEGERGSREREKGGRKRRGHTHTKHTEREWEKMKRAHTVT